MQQILALGLQSMHQDMDRMERVATNMSNALTPGYKRELVIARPFADLVQGGVAASASVLNRLDTESALRSTEPELRTDMRAGGLRATGQPLDVALEGEGYFEVATAAGPAYTRLGRFQLDGRGRLVTGRGDPVMGRGGEIFLSTSAPHIDAAGNVLQPAANGDDGDRGVSAGQLRIVRFEHADQMRRLGDGLLAAPPAEAALPMEEGGPAVRQAYLENSNVSSLQEMVQMMQTMRHFESMQKVVQGYDELLGTAIHKLGDV